jgi:hypothetical protein
MKNFILMLLTIISSSTLYENSIVVEKVVQSKKYTSSCKHCVGREIVTTTFMFTDISCRRFKDDNFAINVNVDRVLRQTMPEKSIKITREQNLMDCRGIGRRYNYKLSTKKIYEGEEYVLENNSILHISKTSYSPDTVKCSPENLEKVCMKQNGEVGVCNWEPFHYYPSCI